MKILRNFALVMALLVFAFGVLGASIWRTAALTIGQGYQISQAEELTEQEEATETAEEPRQEVSYVLPYPGILPDHLLYPLKMVRDKIWLFLTTDSLRKAELYLLFADKRLGAAVALIEKDKLDLGLSTLLKAEKYLEQAINQEKAAKESGKETGAFLEKLFQATLKHEEMMVGLETKISETARPVFDQALQYSLDGHQRVRERMEE